MLARERLLPVDPVLVGLLPERGLRRGSVIGISGSGGASSLLLAMVARPLAEGSWAAVIGIPELGLEAAAGIGVRLDRLALVPRPPRTWHDVVATLIDAVDVVLLRPPARCSPTLANKLIARVHERGCVLVVATPASIAPSHGTSFLWPTPVEFTLEVEWVSWRGLGHGFGTLLDRKVVIVTSGRRVATGPRRTTLYLPEKSGVPAQLDEPAPIPIRHLGVTASAGCAVGGGGSRAITTGAIPPHGGGHRRTTVAADGPRQGGRCRPMGNGSLRGLISH